MNRNPNGSNSGLGGRSLSPNATFVNSRRSSSANPENDNSCRFNYPSPQVSRRGSIISGNVAAFRARSPSDPQNYIGDQPHLSRRFSQPASPSTYRGTYTDNPSPSLVKQERRNYSSLNHLPEIRTYLQFMEDSTVLPQRSKSFNGRNSSRRSSYNRRRPRSRPRTPIVIGDEPEPGLQRVGSGSASYYGHYLSPRGASLDQTKTAHLDDDQGNDADVEDIDAEPPLQNHMSQYNPKVESRMTTATATMYNDCFSQRRSSIRTTFI